MPFFFFDIHFVFMIVKSFMLTHIVTSCNKEELLSPTTKLCCYCLSKWFVLFTVDSLSLSLHPWFLPFRFSSPYSSTSHLLNLSAVMLFYMSLFFFFAIFSIIPSNPCPCCVSPLSLSLHHLRFDIRLSQFQMSWLQSCWVTRRTLAPWSLWSLGGASFTGPSACVYLCRRPGRRARETLGRATPPVCVCFALL